MADIRDKWPWPVNASVLGTYPEEIKELQKMEKNLQASPMPEAAPTKLLTPNRSSDNLRLGEPGQPFITIDPAKAFVLTHVVLRRILLRMRSKGVSTFDALIDSEDLGDVPEGRRAQMKAMRDREKAMLALLGQYNQWAEMVYMKLLSEAEG